MNQHLEKINSTGFKWTAARFLDKVANHETLTHYSEKSMPLVKKPTANSWPKVPDLALGKRVPEVDDEVEIVGFKYNPAKILQKQKSKKKILNDVSKWTANRALIDIDKENSPTNSQAAFDRDCTPEIKRASQVFSSYSAFDDKRRGRSAKNRNIKFSKNYQS